MSNEKDKNMLKVFISQPMAGLSEEEIKKRRNDIKRSLREILKQEFSVIQSVYDDDFSKEKNPSVKYLAKSINDLADADVAFFAHGWEEARGCCIEHEVALQYQIPVIHEQLERVDMQSYTKSYDVIRDEIEKALEAKGWSQTESVKRFSMYVRDSRTPFYSSITINSEEGKIVFDICDKETGYRTITECHFDYMVFKDDVIKMNIPTIKLEILL